MRIIGNILVFSVDRVDTEHRAIGLTIDLQDLHKIKKNQKAATDPHHHHNDDACEV